MAKNIDLNTIAKEYAEGRISREDFLYLHKMLTDQAAKQKGQSQPSRQQAAPPVLQPAAGGGQPGQPRARQPQQRRPVTASQSRRQAGARPQPQAQAQYSVPSLAMPGERRSVLGYIKGHHKEVVALLGTLGLFISMFYNKFETTDPDADNARVVVTGQASQGKTTSIRTQDLKLIAQLIMEDNTWSKELIDDFITQWNHLSDNEKQLVKMENWYFDFSSLLARQIKTTRAKAGTGDVSAIYDQQVLLSLADTLIFGTNAKAKDLLAETVKSTKLAKGNNHGETKKAPTQKSVTTQKEIPAPRPEHTQTAKISQQPRDNGEIAKRHRISRTEIEDVINQFTVAFEAGRSRDLSSLFADDEYSSSFASLDDIKSQYRDLFRHSKERHLDLDSFFWEHDYGETRGTAKYRAKVKMADSNVTKTITADLNITIRRLLGKNYITNFELNNRKVVSSITNEPRHNPKPRKSVTVASSKGKPKFPTPAELQDLVTQYVTAYETGDVNDLMHLFANATWTKSRTGLVEMKQDYDNLFASTSGREMFIKDVKWKVKGKKALGTGDLLLTLHTKDNKVKTQKGKIRIVATKVGNQVRFSQMFHILE
ncbi:MAG: hypothetical protein PVJ39_05800 [Gammaproteobacteria bacterium]|jgi:hypothetical protein